MRFLFAACLAVTASAAPQANFGQKNVLVNERLGLLVPWTQACQETQAPRGGKQCGTRNYAAPVAGLSHGQTSPGEFPWTCILLNQNNDFLGTCAIIPNDSSNNNNVATRKIVTAAHKLKNLEQTE